MRWHMYVTVLREIKQYVWTVLDLDWYVSATGMGLYCEVIGGVFLCTLPIDMSMG